MKKQLFVTGIDTEIGKTVVSAILVETLKADYWKPVQAGDLDDSDSIKIKNWTNSPHIHAEGFRLSQPMSPHAAAKIDNIDMSIKDFVLPKTENNLVVEGAGGLFVPLNDKDCIIDLIEYLRLPVVLVSKNYLGSINHTLLSIRALERIDIPIEGIVFNGKRNAETERIIVTMTGINVLGYIEEMANVSRESISKAAKKLSLTL